MSLGPFSTTYHVEAGYDTNGQLVVNFWPTGSAPNPATSQASEISMVRLAGGQVTAFDQNGEPIPGVAPLANLPLPQPLAYLGSNPGPSVINGMVVSDIQAYATAHNATVTTYPSDCSGSPCGATRYDLTMSVANGGGGTEVWSYVPSGSVYVAIQEKIIPTMSNGSGSRVLAFSNMAWYDNGSNDATRAGRGGTATNPPLKSAATPNLAAPQSSSCGSQQFSGGSTQNIVLQHGLLSSSCTWQRMYGWLQGDFLLGTVLIPSLNSTDSLSNQSSALIGDVNAAGGGGYIFVGHSQGGLLSRDAAQYFQSNSPSKMRGVVTLDTPNEGADLALNAYSDLANIMTGLAVQLYEDTGCASPLDSAPCGVAALLYSAIPALAVYAAQAAVPATGDLVPGSAFLNNLNGTAENFTRVGVTSEAVRRWVEMRLVGDTFCNPDDWCGGRNTVKFTEVVYDVLGIAEAISFLEGDTQDAFFYASLRYDMDLMDSTWNSLIAAPTDGTDGIVQASSEAYPSSAATQYQILFADSHLGTTKSRPAYNSLFQALENQFQVSLLASCSFSVSPSELQISASGGSSSATVNAPGGCPWSATSDSAWLAFNSGSQGNGSGAMGLTVAANSSNVPRTGTITVGNARAQATLIVDQGAPCTYSVPSTAYFPSGGGGGSGSGSIYARLASTASGRRWRKRRG
ncbi:MAG: BACON domain-containing protein [Terriglobales bacterium]